jgi:hypothetical protein
MEAQPTEQTRERSGEWPRALALFGVVLITSVLAHPGVLIGLPLALLLAARGFQNLVSIAVVALVILIVAGGRTGLAEGLWYAERAWAVLLAGWFVAVTLLLPHWKLVARALAAAAGAAGTAAGVLGLRAGSWGALDGAVMRSIQSEIDATIAAVNAIGGPEALSPEMVDMAQQIAAAQVSVFPALLGIESLAALAVAWWARTRLLGETGTALAPLRDFRFNDHLVWVLVVGLVLLLTQSGAALARVGSNAVVFMGALYALRGAAVFVFVSGGVTVFSSVMVAVLFVLVPPVLLGSAALLGIGDTWLDLRSRLTAEAT